MRGSLISAWSYAWQDLWEPLEAHEDSPSELFMELYPELCKALRPPTPQAEPSDALAAKPEVAGYFDVSNDPGLAREHSKSFQLIVLSAIVGWVTFLRKHFSSSRISALTLRSIIRPW